MKRLLSAFLFAVLLSGFVQAQGGISSAGREFYLGMVLPSFNAQNLPLVEQGVLKYYAISALVSSTTDNSIRVSYFDANGNETTPTVYLVGARKAIQIPLDTSRMKPNTLGEAPEYKTCHIISQSPVSIEFFSIGACSGGSYLALPIQCWGKDYVVESYHDNPNGLGGIFSKEKSRGFFQVIAAYDNTSVTITPNTTTSRGKPGVNTGAGSTGVLQPFQISLNRGQTYTVFSSGGDISDDISGSQVKSNKQVAVLGGHENAFTDASNIGSTQLEARDYMIDQMMPIGNWDTAGYYNLPLVDSKPPVQGGEGDEYHVFTGSPNGSNITLNSNIQRDVSLPTTLYPNPVVGKLSITTPVELSETYPGGIFHVVQYDQAMQGSGSPYPRPSMISIVPRSRWSSEYTFQVPNSTFEILQGYFINVILSKVDYDKDMIQICVNGGKFQSMRGSGLSLRKLWGAGTIPDAPDLMGITYALGPGSYTIKNIAKGDSNTTRPGFIVYSYGDRGVNPNGDLGGGSKYDLFFSYGCPTGMISKQYGAAKPKLTATVQGTCGKWNICVNDVGNALNGIRYIELLNYTDNNYVNNPPLARNVMIDQQYDSLGKGEIILSGADKQYCFSVSTISQADSARASIAIYDNSGERIVLSLEQQARFRVSNSGLTSAIASDSLVFKPTAINTTNCTTVTYTNTGDSNIVITSIDIPSNTSNIKLTSNLPVLPLTLHSRDSVSFTFCFTATTTHLASSLFTLHTDCGAPSVFHLLGYGASGLLQASDTTFYGVDTGQTLCEAVTLRNSGSLPFVLEKNPILSDTVHFTIDAGFLSSLPRTMQPGEEIKVRVCYHPTENSNDTALIQWKTNIPSSLEAEMKSVSRLIGMKGGTTLVVHDNHITTDTKLKAYTIGNQLHIIPPEDMTASFECELYDLLGRKVVRWDNSSLLGLKEHLVLPLPNLSSGMYIVRLKYGSKQLSSTVILSN